jgi:ribonuclease-3
MCAGVLHHNRHHSHNQRYYYHCPPPPPPGPPPPPLPPGPPPLPLPPGPPPPLPPGPPPLPPGPPPPLPPQPAPLPPQPPIAQPEISRQDLELVLGFKVCDFQKYLSVFTHKSAMRDMARGSYERYEFIGDAVINFVIAKYLYDKYPNEDEGFLTRVRTKLVSGKCLSVLSQRLGLHRYIIMNQKALRQGWNTNPRILEDVYESLVGCVYLDLGLMTAKTFVLDVMNRFVDFNDIVRDTNYKDILMRHTQAHAMPLPEYHVINDPQVTRAAMFDIVVLLQGVPYGRGSDTCKKGAEQLAAQQALARIGVHMD